MSILDAPRAQEPIIRKKERVPWQVMRQQLAAKMHKAWAYIETFYDTKIKLEELAACVGVSGPYLSRSFHAQFGMTVVHAIYTVRIESAKRLLLAGHEAASVARAVGFLHQPHFIRGFKIITGKTPRKWLIEENARLLSERMMREDTIREAERIGVGERTDALHQPAPI